MKLTATEISKAKPKTKPYRMSDGRGLYLLVTPTGGKLWRWKYRYKGIEKLMSFGRFPDIPLAATRDQLAEQRRILASGVDPMTQRKSTKATAAGSVENSFQSIALQWLDHWSDGKSPRHVDYVRRRLESDIYPRLGARPIAEIEAPELVAMAKAIQDRGARDIAKRALEMTGQIFRYGIAHGFAKRNPVSDFKPSDVLKSAHKVNYACVDAKELPSLLRAIEVYQGTHVTRLAMKIMALSFVRTSELIGARWEEFDMAESRWNIPAERMKMRTPHIVPLATQTLETLEMLKELTGASEFLFPGDRNPKRPMSNNTILGALKRMGYQGLMTGHGFRGLASTILHEQGYDHEHIELQLAHAPRNAMSATYNHALYLEPRAKMMQDWADFLEQTLRKGNVLPFRKDVA
jgi:integrase